MAAGIAKVSVGPLVVENIYDPAFIASERTDTRSTVVFDLDNTLLVVRDGEAEVRPQARATLEALRDQGIKLVLWTNSPTAYALRHLRATGLYELFDVIITKEAYCNAEVQPWQSETARQAFDQILGAGATDRLEELEDYQPMAKNLAILGYRLIVEDNPRISFEVEDAREIGWNYEAIQCSYFNGATETADDFGRILPMIQERLLGHRRR